LKLPVRARERAQENARRGFRPGAIPQFQFPKYNKSGPKSRKIETHHFVSRFAERNQPPPPRPIADLLLIEFGFCERDSHPGHAPDTC
jgi:hypothetical protein